MEEKLYPHNQEAYEKILEDFKTKNRVCVVQPTGSGKSLIIATICKHFNNVLILAPNNIVLNQIKQNISENIPTFHTYAYLLQKELIYSYDLIILDEFHRLGAPKWGEAVNKVLENNPQAKILGCSATPIRKSEQNRNMAEELFNSNIASYITVNDAIQNNILPSPIYVTGLVDFDSVYKRVSAIIQKSHIIKEKEKAKRIKKLDQIKLAWVTAKGMPKILRKYVPKETKKMLVFCDHITSIDKAKKKLRPWFREARLPLGDVYSIHSKMSSGRVQKEMKAFKENKTNKGISVMVSVNMLNEGIHIPGIEVVLLLRKTQSSIIYLQQIGRCLLANTKKRPVILDMVDNIYNSKTNWLISSTEEESSSFRKKRRISLVVSKFEIHDLLKETKNLVEELTQDIIPNLKEKYISFEKRLNKVIKFISVNRRLPIRDNQEEYEEYINWQNIMQKWKTDKRVEDIILKYGTLRNPEIAKFKLLTFIKRTKRLPCHKKNSLKEEISLYTYFNSHKEELLKDEEFKQLYLKYNQFKDYERGFDHLYLIVEEYCKKYNRLPTTITDEESRKACNAYTYIRNNYGDKEEVNNLRFQYSATNKGQGGIKAIETVKLFVEKYGYLPYNKEFGKANSAWNRLRYYFNNPLVKTFVDEMNSKYQKATKEAIEKTKAESTKRGWSLRKSINSIKSLFN